MALELFAVKMLWKSPSMTEKVVEVALKQLGDRDTMIRDILAISISLSSPTASHDVLRRGMQCRPEIDRQVHCFKHYPILVYSVFEVEPLLCIGYNYIKS
jgi:hypothetical protein